MREWPQRYSALGLLLPIMTKILLKFYSDTKRTQTPVREKNLLKRTKFVKNLCKKKKRIKKNEKKMWKNCGVQCD